MAGECMLLELMRTCCRYLLSCCRYLLSSIAQPIHSVINSTILTSNVSWLVGVCLSGSSMLPRPMRRGCRDSVPSNATYYVECGIHLMFDRGASHAVALSLLMASVWSGTIS